MFTTSRTAAPAQLFGDDAVLRREPSPGIDGKEHDVGFVDRLPRLPRHLVVDAFGRDRLEAAGIDDEIRLVPYPALAVMAVARDPGRVGDDRIAAARQSVEKRRLADIGPARR